MDSLHSYGGKLSSFASRRLRFIVDPQFQNSGGRLVSACTIALQLLLSTMVPIVIDFLWPITAFAYFVYQVLASLLDWLRRLLPHQDQVGGARWDATPS